MTAADQAIIAKRNRAAVALCGILGIAPVSWARLGVMIGGGKVSLAKVATAVQEIERLSGQNAIYSTQLVSARQHAAEQEAEIKRLRAQLDAAIDGGAE